MSGKPTFASVRKLFGGAALASPPEDHEDDAGANADSGKPAPVAGPSESQVAALVASERTEAAAAATTAANERWNAVMTSDHGQASPKAAARLLNTSTMSSDDIVATLGDIAPASGGGAVGAGADTKPGTTGATRPGDREKLAGNADAKPDTGTDTSAPTRRGEEATSSANATVREQRAARGKQRAASAEKTGARFGNATVN